MKRSLAATAAVGSRGDCRLSRTDSAVSARTITGMRCLVLTIDYDGTIATGGQVKPAALVSIERLRGSGRRTPVIGQTSG